MSRIVSFLHSHPWMRIAILFFLVFGVWHLQAELTDRIRLEIRNEKNQNIYDVEIRSKDGKVQKEMGIIPSGAKKEVTLCIDEEILFTISYSDETNGGRRESAPIFAQSFYELVTLISDTGVTTQYPVTASGIRLVMLAILYCLAALLCWISASWIANPGGATKNHLSKRSVAFARGLSGIWLLTKPPRDFLIYFLESAAFPSSLSMVLFSTFVAVHLFDSWVIWRIWRKAI